MDVLEKIIWDRLRTEHPEHTEQEFARFWAKQRQLVVYQDLYNMLLKAYELGVQGKPKTEQE